ncbi:MAG: acetyl-CoA carboxylase biotin carboxyl carrier protein subunit [Bacteroidales bacterium]|nr:acetyl-CoA carboxylase biotin carboxyl carrier protein subunit [Bacteroidales bacterium]
MKNYKLKINGNDYNVEINEVEGQEIKLEVNGTPYNVTIDQEMHQHRTHTTVISDRTAPRVSAANGDVQRASAPKPGSAAGGTKITTPLPGTILDVFVNVGDQVKVGQTVVLLEAMKMENNIESDTEGTVISVNVRKGDSVLEGETLVVIN